MADTLPATHSRRGPRFSLRGLAAVMTIIALAVGLYASGRRNARLQAENARLRAVQGLIALENKKYRDELGILEVEDPSRIHVIRVPSDDDEPSRYRVYLPPGRQYTVNYQANRIPEMGVGEHPNPHTVEPGEYLISIGLERQHDRKTGEPVPVVLGLLDIDPTSGQRFSSSSSMVSITEAQNDWILNQETGNLCYSSQGIGREVKTFAAGEPVVLFRARAYRPLVRRRDAEGKPVRWSTQAIQGNCDGFMVWIEAEKPAAANRPSGGG